VVTIGDKVDLADLDQLDRRQFDPPLPGRSDAQPTVPGVDLERSKVSVEIVAAALAVPDLELVDRVLGLI